MFNAQQYFNTPNSFYEYIVARVKRGVCQYVNYIFCEISGSYNVILQELWEEAVKYPLHGMLHDSSSYSISYVNAMAQREMLVDENKRLCDVRPFLAVLNIVERQEDKADNVLNAQISNLIGKGMY